MKIYTTACTPNSTLILTCEPCRRIKILEADLARDFPPSFKTRCACGSTFQVTINRRQWTRQDAHLPGIYVKRDAVTDNILEQGHLVIQDISRTGIRFHTLAPHSIGLNETLVVTFTLDDPQNTVIQRSVRPRYIDTNMIGGEFFASDVYTDRRSALEGYLQQQAALASPASDETLEGPCSQGRVPFGCG